jgi:four helix bundle protein
MVDALPNSTSAHVIGKQLIRSSTSVAANYRASCRARSTSEFIAKLGIVLEESDESLFWLEMILEAGLMTENKLSELLKEADELTAIFTKSLITAKTNRVTKSKI